jgi:hypothetical protein
MVSGVLPPVGSVGKIYGGIADHGFAGSLEPEHLVGDSVWGGIVVVIPVDYVRRMGVLHAEISLLANCETRLYIYVTDFRVTGRYEVRDFFPVGDNEERLACVRLSEETGDRFREPRSSVSGEAQAGDLFDFGVIALFL